MKVKIKVLMPEKVSGSGHGFERNRSILATKSLDNLPVLHIGVESGPPFHFVFNSYSSVRIVYGPESRVRVESDIL